MDPSQQTDVLDPNTLPVDPREAAMLLLGMTASELKSIDEKVISGRNSVGGLRSDIKKIVSDIRGIIPQQNVPVVNQQPIPVITPSVVNAVPPVLQSPVQTIPQTQSVDENKDQLEFDFYKKIKPEDIEYQLRVIKSNIESVEEKVNYIIQILKKKELTDGNHDQ